MAEEKDNKTKSKEESIIYERPSWDDYFMTITMLAATKSTCIRRKVGAIAVLEKKILATGYNGAPKKTKECVSMGYCKRQKLNIPSGERHELCRAVHAEENVIAQAASYGIPLKGSTLYVTNHPCSLCAKLIVNASIEEIIYLAGYEDKYAKEYLDEARIPIRQMSMPKIEIPRDF